MFERFRERARQVIVLSQDEARTLKHDFIGTEHLLLGMIREEHGYAARTLEALGISIEKVRARVVKIDGLGEEVGVGQIPFTPRTKKVLELALREAMGLGHNYISTEHLLLGLVQENDGVAARILLDLDADAEKVRKSVINLLNDRPIDAEIHVVERIAPVRVKDLKVRELPSGDLKWLIIAATTELIRRVNLAVDE